LAAPDEDPFALLDDQPPVGPAPVGTVGGGWFGFLGYGLVRRLEPVGASPPPPRRLPDSALAFYDHLLHADPDGRWWFEALWTPARASFLDRRLADLQARVDAAPRARPFATAPWTHHPSDGGHALAVAAARERIHAGDIFQVNVCRRLGSRLTGDPIDLFAVAVAVLSPARAAFLGGPWGAVASLSPELFLERRGRRVRSAPIKGTGRRPRDPAAAAAAAAALGASAKDRAENVMIVDLVRNDLGRVCGPGSIHVPALAERQAHTGVWHLVSEVAGDLRPDVGDADLLRATFPPGSVTGAPKVAAIDVIAELESSAREVYTGAIGFAGPVAGLELSVAIRTFEFHGREAWLGVGGGIVADSDPGAEVAECETKAAPLLAAIGARAAPARPAGAGAPRPRRLGPRPLPRPDPAAGVFETLLARDGRPVALGLHLARLGASVGALYGRPVPAAGLAGRIAAAAAGDPEAGRLRVSARPGPGRQLEVTIVTTRLPTERPAVRLRTTTVPGGIGAHKWCDRRLLDALAEALAPDQPLVCDADGRLLETGRANLFVVSPDGALCTPPVAGRLLPGVTRARVIAAARGLGLEVRAVELRRIDLRRAREVFVTGALGGVEAVEACDSWELDGGAREVAGRLGRVLAAPAPPPAGSGQVERGSDRFSKIAITLRDRFSE
ncbi:MAG: para-aminobenzoate synthetase / 4-amino-4-deoxychorismate lyase, partial [Solirubrobacteraceae bacterium]|nr:para-aminobenzoate synthetase / 4-amino-4-deoxychorismate lyase [Solirubrobacteraceae bacterium]